MIRVIKSLYMKAVVSLSSMNNQLKLAVAIPLILCSTESMAADTIWDMFNSFASGFSSMQTGIINVGRVIGVILILLGLVMLYNKNQRGADIKGLTIVIAIIVGGILVVLPQFINNTSNSVGLSGSTVS